MLGAAIIVIETFRSTDVDFVRDQVEGTKKEGRILTELKAGRNLMREPETRKISEKRERISENLCAIRLF
jgi:hypothetical protein